MKHVKGFVLSTLLLLAIWLLLTYPFSTQELVAGAIAAVVISLISSGALGVMQDIRVTPRAIVAALSFLVAFLGALVRSNLDVAFRVLQPSLPISPGIVRIRTSLRTPLARTLLANAITLTPGTITVEARDDVFYVHWISVAGGDTEDATRRIVGTFERYLEVFLG
jgi:multicomponent Na+:H+ antiporter subunit E